MMREQTVGGETVEPDYRARIAGEPLSGVLETKTGENPMGMAGADCESVLYGT